MDSDEYGTASAKALTSAALYQYFGGGSSGMAAVAVAISLYDSFKADKYGTTSANQNFNYHPKLNFNDNQKYQKKLVANDNYENIFMLLINKNA
jgi:hypothetical protein